jgi:hypothetical protein
MIGSIVGKTEKYAIDAWATAADRITAEINEMTPEQLKSFSLGEGSRPMSYERYEAEFSRYVEGGVWLDWNKIEADEITNLARKKIVFLWGISDAACQTKLVTKL